MPASRRHAAVGRVGNPAVVLLALGLALGGCGSGSGSGDVKAKPAAPQGAVPVAWVGAFCGGLGDVIAAASEISKSQPTPQGQKDGLIKFADSAQRAFTDTARKLTQLGPPGITDSKRVQDSAVGYFTTEAAAIGDQRTKLVALDVKDPGFVQKASDLTGHIFGQATAAQMQGLVSNQELGSAFGAAPECTRLSTTPGSR